MFARSGIYIYVSYIFITLENITNTAMMTIIVPKNRFFISMPFAAEDRSEEITLVRWPWGKMEPLVVKMMDI
jgi:hypothetical protein